MLNDSTQAWFTNLADWFGLPTIPVFNSANKAATFTEIVTNELLTAVPFNWMLGELSPA